MLRPAAAPKGSINTNYHLWAGGQRYFLRLNEGKTDAEVLFEASVLRYLEEARFPAVRLRVAQDGRCFVPVAGRQAMLFQYAPGEEVTREALDPAHCRRVGEQLGRLRDLASGLSGTRENPYGRARVADWLQELEPDGGGDPDVAAALPMLRDELERATKLPAGPRGLVHGDLFVDNVLWIGPGISSVLDWEMSCTDVFDYDLAVTINAWCFTDRFDRARVEALLAGYRSKHKIDSETRAALYPYARYAALRYTASRIHAFHLADLSADRLAWKDWRRYRLRVEALREMGEAGFEDLIGR